MGVGVGGPWVSVAQNVESGFGSCSFHTLTLLIFIVTLPPNTFPSPYPQPRHFSAAPTICSPPTVGLLWGPSDGSFPLLRSSKDSHCPCNPIRPSRQPGPTGDAPPLQLLAPPWLKALVLAAQPLGQHFPTHPWLPVTSLKLQLQGHGLLEAPAGPHLLLWESSNTPTLV